MAVEGRTSDRSSKGLFLRFVAVGLLNTAFGYACFALLLQLGLHYSLAILVSTALGVLFNFRTTGRLVFGSRENRLILRFIAVYVGVYTVNTLGVGMLGHIGISNMLAAGLLTLPMAAFAFLLQRKFVFTE